ncbi:hypothetical protein GJ496_010167 [Pomphorhynchus laevis]|nr:hypothetical protein GJ496_010167 [Pomphorhynchus laevis]
MKYLEELDLSNNPLKNIQRFDIGVNTQLRKLMLTNSDMDEININISLPGNVSLIQVHITSICGITTRNCLCSDEELMRDALERRFQGTNDFVDSRPIKCSRLHIIAASWSCEDYNKLFIHLECFENIRYNSN